MEYFTDVKNKIPFEGPHSDNPLAYRFYEEDRIIAGKSMKDHLRFAICYWHTMNGSGQDIFGAPVFHRPWNYQSKDLSHAKQKMDAAFEFFSKLGIPFWCFHDRDIAPEGDTFSESNRNLWTMVEHAKKKQEESGIQLLWGTANLFSHPRYSSGAMTSPQSEIFSYAAAQVKNALDATKELGGVNYVFWGGREGYENLNNTNYGLEQDNMANFLQMVVDYKKKINFNGTLLIEPKPKEPMKHQYDFDAATVLNFLKRYQLQDEFKLNIEANHATLAGHTFCHELTVASQENALGSIDLNTGDPLLGWDTDQFHLDTKEAALAMLVIFKQGGLGTGGFNFDAKTRRSSTDTTSLFYGHISSIDNLAKGLIIADKIIKDGKIEQMIDSRYESFQNALGKKIVDKKMTLEDLEKAVLDQPEPALKSSENELFEMIINRYLD